LVISGNRETEALAKFLDLKETQEDKTDPHN
jgi:hypothetical protein